jgi:hypothetical protein
MLEVGLFGELCIDYDVLNNKRRLVRIWRKLFKWEFSNIGFFLDTLCSSARSRSEVSNNLYFSSIIIRTTSRTETTYRSDKFIRNLIRKFYEKNVGEQNVRENKILSILS